ncbi:MAG TPA: PIN domain-containing protein [Pirellulaceae bacterium]|nr:PIN domain-containing protein [Pirellulaceae bacterium]
MIAVDTNVLVYAVDQLDPVRHAKAVQLLGQLRTSGQTLLLWQVAAELLAKLRQWEHTNRITTHVVEGYVKHFLAMFPLTFPTERVLQQSIELSRKYSLSHWDAMVLSACLDAGVDTLHSEDLTHGAVYETVTVLNPFV